MCRSAALAAPVWTQIGGGTVSAGSAGNVRIAVAGDDVFCTYLDSASTWKPVVKKTDGDSWMGGVLSDCTSYSIDIEKHTTNGHVFAAFTDITNDTIYVQEYNEINEIWAAKR